MAVYAFFKPSSFKEGSNGFDGDPSNMKYAYDGDISGSNYGKTQTDAGKNNFGLFQGLTFFSSSSASNYKNWIVDKFPSSSWATTTFTDSIPSGAVIDYVWLGGSIAHNKEFLTSEAAYCYLFLSTQDSRDNGIFFNAKMDEITIDGGSRQNFISGSFPGTISQSQLFTYNTSWIKDTLRLGYNVRSIKSVADTNMKVYEVFMIGRIKVPYEITVNNGYLDGTNALYGLREPSNSSFWIYLKRNPGYNANPPTITTSIGSSSQFSINENDRITLIPSQAYKGTVTFNPNTLTVNYISGLPGKEATKISYQGNTLTENQLYMDRKQILSYNVQNSNGLSNGQNSSYLYMEKTGYLWTKKWQMENGLQIDEGDLWTGTGFANVNYDFNLVEDNRSIDVYGVWEPISYTISFNGNGATFGGIDSFTTKYDTDITIPKNNFKKNGYIFKGWNTKIDGSGIAYIENTISKNLTAEHNKEVVLYAQWEFVGDINYNNLFSLSDWGTSSSGAIDGEYAKTTNLNINFKDGFINIKDISSPSPYDAYTRYGPDSNFYHISVNPNTDYFFNFTITQNYSSNDQGQFFVFYYTLDENTNNLKQSTIRAHQGWRPITTTGNYSNEFKTPSDCVAIGLRFGIYSSLADITFSNILICEKTKYNNIISKIPNYKIRDYLPEITSIQELPSLNTGYLFDGWRAENNKLASTLTLSGVKSSISSIIAYSFERPITYKIHFNKNCQEGTGIISSQTFTYDEPKKLTKSEAFQRYRYRFVNWKATLNNEELFFDDEQEILNLFSNQDDEITLYAQWEYVPIENTIKLDNNIFASKVLFDNIPVIEILIDKTVFFREHL